MIEIANCDLRLLKVRAKKTKKQPGWFIGYYLEYDKNRHIVIVEKKNYTVDSLTVCRQIIINKIICYEKDILLINNKKYLILWHDNKWMLCDKNMKNHDMSFLSMGIDFEIIGNIIDDPELMEKNNEIRKH